VEETEAEHDLAHGETQRMGRGAREDAQLLKFGLQFVKGVSSTLQLIVKYPTREHVPYSIVTESVAGGKTQPSYIHIDEDGESD